MAELAPKDSTTSNEKAEKELNEEEKKNLRKARFIQSNEVANTFEAKEV